MALKKFTALVGLIIATGFSTSLDAQTVANIPGTKCPAFPANSWWHADVSKLKAHPRSSLWIKNMGSPGRTLRPDFGPSYGELKGPYGIPITIVGKSHPKVRVKFDYARESDKGPYPLGPKTKVEGWSYDKGDRHTIVIDKSTCRLYETWATRRSGKNWLAGSGAIWDLRSNKLRPKGWTSADAAGLPILPGLLRYDEVKRGKVDHAIRFTAPRTSKAFLWPARHFAGTSNPDYPPMGARFRLKASYKIDPKLRKDTKVILEAMKKYGMVLADNGSSWYFQGTADKRWPAGLIKELKLIPASAFEAVDTLPLQVHPDSMEVKEAPDQKQSQHPSATPSNPNRAPTDNFLKGQMPPQGKNGNESEDYEEDASLKEGRALNIINRYRASIGAAPLQLDGRLSRIATTYSHRMARTNVVSHSLNGETLGERLQLGGYAFSAAFENIAAGYQDAPSVIAAWQKSPGHDRNLRDPNVTAMGIGFATNPRTAYGTFWTLILAKPGQTNQTATNAR